MTDEQADRLIAAIEKLTETLSFNHQEAFGPLCGIGEVLGRMLHPIAPDGSGGVAVRIVDEAEAAKGVAAHKARVARLSR